MEGWGDPAALSSASPDEAARVPGAATASLLLTPRDCHCVQNQVPSKRISAAAAMALGKTPSRLSRRQSIDPGVGARTSSGAGKSGNAGIGMVTGKVRLGKAKYSEVAAG
jgi:hypothetical protein